MALKISYYDKDDKLLGSKNHADTEDANPKVATEDEKKLMNADLTELKTKSPDVYKQVAKVQVGEAFVPVNVAEPPAPATPPPADPQPAASQAQTGGQTAATPPKPLKIKIDPDATADTAAAPSSDPATKPNIRGRVELEGGGFPASGEHPHVGGLARVSGGVEIPLTRAGKSWMSLIPTLFAQVKTYDRNLETPGGEKVHSGAVVPAGGLAVLFGFRPDAAGGIFNFLFGPSVAVGGLVANEHSEVSLPASCVPGEFLPGECTPGAGPRGPVPSGLDGWLNPDGETAGPAKGPVVSVELPIKFQADVYQGESVAVALGASYAPTATFLPNGHVQADHELGATLTFTIGKRTESKPAGTTTNTPPKPKDSDGDGVVDADDKCHNPANKDVDATGCPKKPTKKEEPPAKIDGAVISDPVSAAEDTQQFTVKFKDPVSGKVLSAVITGGPKNVSVPAKFDPTELKSATEVVVTPPSKLEAGDYSVAIVIEGPDGKKSVATATLTVKGDLKVSKFLTSPSDGAEVRAGDKLSLDIEQSQDKTALTIRYVKKDKFGQREAVKGSDASVGTIKTAEKRDIQIGQDLEPGDYFVDFEFKAPDGSVVTKTVSYKIKKADVKVNLAPSFKVGDVLTGEISGEPGTTVTYTVSGNGKTSPTRTIAFKDAPEKLDLKVPGTLVTQNDKIHRLTKPGTYTLKVTYDKDKTVERQFTVTK